MSADYFTSTLEDAGAYEAMRAQDEYLDERPTLAELGEDDWSESTESQIAVPAGAADPFAGLDSPGEPPF